MCVTKHCRKPGYRGNYCHSCSKRRYKERHPERYAYTVLRNNAKRRGKEFDLTYEQFLEFAVKSGYIAGRGIYKESLHIDRIDESKGYTMDNIQVLTNTQNIKKYMTYNYDQNGVPCDFRINKSLVMVASEDDPF
jgi:hypothetical protein